MKALFSEKVVSKIEKDIGCKIKIEEKFIIVSGKDRLILAKGVDAVHKIKEEGDKKGGSSSHISRSRSPERKSPVSARFARSDSQRSFQSPQAASHFQQRFPKQDKVVEDHVREDLKMLSRGSPQGRGIFDFSKMSRYVVLGLFPASIFTFQMYVMYNDVACCSTFCLQREVSSYLQALCVRL